MTLPLGIVREVFAREDPDRLLHLLSEAEAPVQYAQAREALGLHPERFARALRALEKWGLIQLRVVPRRERPDQRRRVRLELTALGHAAVRLHTAMEREWQRIAQDEGISPETFAGS